MRSNIRCMFMYILLATFVPAVAEETPHPCFTTSSASCETVYLSDPNLILSMVSCGECNLGPLQDECNTADEWVYHINSSENAIVDPWALPASSGKAEIQYDSLTRAVCGTKKFCKWKCEKDENDEYQCVESDLTLDWDFPTSQAFGANCP
jgi:hypothetical protein